MGTLPLGSIGSEWFLVGTFLVLVFGVCFDF